MVGQAITAAHAAAASDPDVLAAHFAPLSRGAPGAVRTSVTLGQLAAGHLDTLADLYIRIGNPHSRYAIARARAVAPI